MNSIDKYIDEFGWKHGWLLFAREKGIKIPDIYVWKINESPDWKQISPILWKAQNGIVIRTSVSDDFRGIIDQMPTHFFGIPKSEAQLAEWITWIIEEIEQDYETVRIHAQEEWTHYNLTDITFSISPYLGKQTIMATEHPNFEWILADTQVRSPMDDTIHMPSEWWGLTWHASKERALLIQQSVRELLWLPLNMSYQFEIWWDEQANIPVLLQIREFAQRNPLEIAKGVVPNLRYFLGNDWSKIIVPILSFKYLDEVWYETHPYAAFMRGWFWQSRKWKLQNNAQGIITKRWWTCLSHILAQPVISILKKEGFALLNIQTPENAWPFDLEKDIQIFHDPEVWIQWKQED